MAEKFQSLADLLGTGQNSAEPEPPQLLDSLSEPTTAEDFASKILNSQVFRSYIINGLTLGELPSAIICRLMDYGWGKPVERIVHSAPDGGPIVTVIERVIIDARPQQQQGEEKAYTVQ